jgi:hypothetical protein
MPTNGSVQATWTAHINGGSPQYAYQWGGEGLPLGQQVTASTTISETVTYNATGSRNAYFQILTDSSDPALQTELLQCPALNVVDASTVLGVGSCAVPRNAVLCRNSGIATGTASVLYQYGASACQTTTLSCQFQCRDNTYVVRDGACVKRSSTIEQ